MNLDKNNSRRDFLRHSALAAAGLAIAPASLAGAPSSEAPAGEASTGGFHQMTGGFGTLPQLRWPGRLVVDGKTLDDFVAVSEKPSADGAWTDRVFESVSVPTLQIHAQWRVIGGATEWIPFLVNNSPRPSGKVTELRSLAASWPTRGDVDLYWNKGSEDNALDDFIDQRDLDIQTAYLMPSGGRSSEGVLPFFALTDRHDSLAIGIGWTGRWCATMRHADGALQLEVGLPKVGFVLRPQESVRLPSLLLTRAPGAPAEQAQRILRAHMAKYVTPKTPDGKCLNFVAHGKTWDYLMDAAEISEAGELAEVERAAKMGCEVYWIDAAWFGDARNWDGQVGNWYVRKSEFPRGLLPIRDRARELGMKFCVWHDPERARPGTKWVREHPELFLHYPDNKNPDSYAKRGLLLNLADPRGLDFAFAELSAWISEFKIDVLRQDFNMNPLDAWYAADAPDRIGITEIRYIEGLYALWDRLVAAHPGLTIDNCASGGRRLDLETTRRAIPLWRSDSGFGTGAKTDVVHQVQCWGLGHWLPDHSGPIIGFDAYAVRSACATGLMIFMPQKELDRHAPDYAEPRAAIAENKRLRPYMFEERIGLRQPYLKDDVWAAYTAFQHHRHSDSSGFMIALRGPGKKGDVYKWKLNLEYIDANARYRVTRWDEYVASPPVEMAGAELKEIAPKLAKPRSSVLFEYQRVS